MPAPSPSRRILDQVYSLARLEAFEPPAFGEALEAELAALPAETIADHEARDAAARAALAAIEELATRAMRLRLEYALAHEPAFGAPTRNVFAATIAQYEHDLPLLADRARSAASHGRAHDPDVTADLVVAAARAVLDVRAQLQQQVGASVQRLAAAALPDAEARARDRKRADPERTQWSAVRRDLARLAQQPTWVATAPLAQRMAALPALLDEPDPEREVSFADMIELD